MDESLESLLGRLLGPEISYLSIDKAGSVAKVCAWHRVKRKPFTGYHENAAEALRMALDKAAAPEPSTSLEDLF